MPIFAVRYDYDSRADVRDTFRPEHREFLGVLADQGSVLARGPFSDDGPAGALLLVRADNAAAAEQLLDADPFQREGLITTRTVRQWNPLGDHPWGE